MRHSCERFSQHHNQRGFTIIEVIAVLVIIGIVTVITISGSTSGDSYKVASEAQTLKTYLRFAQSRSMSDETTSGWGVLLAADSYTLQKNGATAPYFLPDETSATHYMQSGVTITGCTNCVNSTVTFDEWGSPGSATLSIALSPATPDIIVTQTTGFIP